jgi:hypothetical protein
LKIVGILSWYDESPTWLAAATAGFARFCDEIVAVDGAYALYPGATARSRPDQVEAILHTCEAAGIGCTIHQPSDVWWGNELEKRNYSLQLAGLRLDEQDWLCVFDADYHVMQARPEEIRYELANTDLNVATYTILDGKDLQADEWMAAYAENRPIDTQWTGRTRDLYRYSPSLRYVGTHYCVTGRYDGRQQWLRGYESEFQYLEPELRLEDALVVHHRTQHRPLVRRSSADSYYKHRDASGIEQHPDVTVEHV